MGGEVKRNNLLVVKRFRRRSVGAAPLRQLATQQDFSVQGQLCGEHSDSLLSTLSGSEHGVPPNPRFSRHLGAPS